MPMPWIEDALPLVEPPVSAAFLYPGINFVLTSITFHDLILPARGRYFLEIMKGHVNAPRFFLC